MDKELKKQIILFHNKTKNNFVTSAPSDFDIMKKVSLESCTDDWTIFIKFDKELIKNISYLGDGCSISTSVLSILSEMLIGKTREYGIFLINNFEKFINKKDFDKSLLLELEVFEGVSDLPNRVPCALGSPSIIRNVLGGKYE